MKYLKIILAASFLLNSCKPIETVYKNQIPEAQHTTVNKVLVIGLTAQKDARELFEKKTVKLLHKKGILAVKSVDYFEDGNSINTKKIDSREEDLLNKGFNGILVSRVTGTDERKTILQSILNIKNVYSDFDMDKPIENKLENTEDLRFLIYNTQTALYCICAEKERALIWETGINLKKHKQIKRDINKFSRYLITEVINDSLIVRY